VTGVDSSRAASGDQIRRVRPGDAGLLRALRLRALAADPGAFGSTYEDTARRGDRQWQAWAREHSAGADHCTLIAVRAGQAAGMVRAERDPARPEVFWIYSLWVAPEARRQALGRRLLARAEEWIGASGGGEVELDVVDRETSAVRLYERAGYRPDGRRGPARQPEAIEVGMRKTLALRP
jgi:ribosomal protein S18 acetylase RimI-like enzyme